MKPIELPVFHETDSTATLASMGIDANIEDCEIRSITFYNINGIGIYKSKGKEYGVVMCNGEDLITPCSYEELKHRIK